MVMPLNANRVLTYFDLTTMTNRSSKAYYISDEILRVMQSYINTMRAIQKAVFIEFEKRRIDIYEQLLHIPKPNTKKVRGQKKENESSLKELFLIGNEGDDCSKQRKNYAEKNYEMMGNAFQGYLFDICNKLRDVYVPMYIREVHTCAGNMKELPVNALKSVSPDDKINMFTLDKRI